MIYFNACISLNESLIVNLLKLFLQQTIMKRAPVLAAFREAGLIDSFPLHDDEALKRVYTDWSRAKLLAPPVDAIRDYFGENIALYVSFTSFYTRYLIPTAILGVGQVWPLKERFFNGGHANYCMSLIGYADFDYSKFV